MYPGVLGQVARVGKRLCTLGALVRFGFAHVQLAAVQLQVALVGKDLEVERSRRLTLDSDSNHFERSKPSPKRKIQ